MKRRIVTPQLILLFFITCLIGVSAQSMELSDLVANPDEKKVFRKPAIVYELSDIEEKPSDQLEQDVSQNLESLNETTKVLKEMGVVDPNCADCESLTNRKMKGRSPALEIRP